jgi:hypothetical protein
VDLAAVLRKTGFQIDEMDQEGASTVAADAVGEGAENTLAEESAADLLKPHPRRRKAAQAAEEELQAEPSPESEPVEKPAVDLLAAVPRPRKAAESEEQEVSIDDYMSRLLARSRGDAPPSARPAAGGSQSPAIAPPVVAPRLAANPAASAPQAEPAPAGEAGEMAPRAVAPETQIDMKAMRQLANLSAKTALHKSESKQLSGSTRAKLLVTTVALGVGGSLSAMRLLPGAPPLTIYGSVAAFSVAALWGVSYLTLLSRVTGDRLARVSRHLKADEEPAVEVMKKKA